MSIKRTEEFVYFQSKAKHYDNIQKIKPVIKTRSPNLSVNSEHHYHKIPHMKKYDIVQTNEALVKGILDIRHSPKTQIQTHGYTRYNGFQKKFNDYFRQTQRFISIDRQNKRNQSALGHIKPVVGTITDWNDRYTKNQNTKKLISRNNKDGSSKGLSLIKSKDKFIPNHYLKLQQREQSITNLNNQKKSQLPRLTSTGLYDFAHIIKDKSGDLHL